MLPFIPLVVAGGALGGALALQRRQQPTRLRQKLITHTSRANSNTATPSTLTQAPVLSSLRAYFSLWDKRYQALVQQYIDPLLLGKMHNEQLQALTNSSVRQLSEGEKSANRKLLLGIGTFSFFALAQLTTLPLIPFILAIGLYSMSPALKEGWRIATQEKRFSLIHLMVLYLSVLWFGGYYLIGTLGVIFLNLNRKVELLIQNITRHRMTHLLGEQPQTVWVLIDGSEIEIAFDQLQIGDILILNAGQPVPIDGVVVQGSATIDQHRLTGESQPVEKSAGDPVLASTLVLGGRLEVRVEKTGAETTAAKIGEILNGTIERQESYFADMYRVAEGARWPMLALGSAGFLFIGPTTGVALLGCNYLLSVIPLRLMTLLNGLKTGAQNGVLIKDGRALEYFSSIDTIVFDKTGTLTLEQPEVSAIHCVGSWSETEVLLYAASAEQRQSHPIAQAILAKAEQQPLTLLEMEEAYYELGMGLTTKINGRTIKIGSKRFLNAEAVSLPIELETIETQVADKGNALIFVAVDNQVSGAIELTATLRPEASEIIEWFKQQGIALYIISGDQEAPTRKIATALGMDGYFANTLPEQKAVHVQALQAQGRKVCFIGDGINDAIALHQADVSISLKGATTIATDAAQVVLMNNDLAQLKLFWQLARGFDKNLKTNKRLAIQFSVAAAAGVVFLPFKFLIVELLWGSQALTGLKVAHRSLLNAPNQPSQEPAAHEHATTS